MVLISLMWKHQDRASASLMGRPFVVGALPAEAGPEPEGSAEQAAGEAGEVGLPPFGRGDLAVAEAEAVRGGAAGRGEPGVGVETAGQTQLSLLK